MVTKAELLQQRVDQETERIKQGSRTAQEAQAKAVAMQAAHMEHVETMLAGELGEILVSANATGHDAIRLGSDYVWESFPSSSCLNGRAWRLHEGCPSPLRFNPSEGYPPATRAAEILRQAGFEVSLSIWPYGAYTSSWFIEIDWSD